MRSVGTVAFVTLLSACNAPDFTPPAQSLPVVHAFDADAAARGWNLLSVTTVGKPAVPRIGIESLFVVWPDGGNFPGDYWSAFRARYGLHEAPFDNDGLPLGIRPVGKYVTFDCLLCHAGTVGGKAMLGVAKSERRAHPVDETSAVDEPAAVDGRPHLGQRQPPDGLVRPER